MRAALLCLALVAALAAACLETPKIKDYRAAGRDGWFSIGYAYDGRAAVPFDGTIFVEANDAANSGEAHAMGTLNGQEWFVDFDRFFQQAGKAFQDGGIAANLQEHGATGVADTSIPEVHVDMAAWGDALLTAGGAPLKDPITSEATWVAHYMVITTGVRDNETHGIYNAGQTAPYNPQNASDGYVEPGDFEIHLVLKSHATPHQNESQVTPAQGTMNGPHNMRYTIYTNAYAGSRANLTLTVGSPTTVNLVGSPRYIVKDPDGAVVHEFSNLASGRETRELPFDKLGDYTFEASGNAVNLPYGLSGPVKPPAAIVMNFWWEDVVFGQAAADLQESQPHGHGEGAA